MSLCSLCCVWGQQGVEEFDSVGKKLLLINVEGGEIPTLTSLSSGRCSISCCSQVPVQTVMQLVRFRTLRKHIDFFSTVTMVVVLKKSFRDGGVALVTESQQALPHKLRVSRIKKQHHGINTKSLDL